MRIQQRARRIGPCPQGLPITWAASDSFKGSELNNQGGKTQDKWAEEEEGKLRRVLRTGLYGEVTFMLRPE